MRPPQSLAADLRKDGRTPNRHQPEDIRELLEKCIRPVPAAIGRVVIDRSAGLADVGPDSPRAGPGNSGSSTGTGVSLVCTAFEANTYFFIKS
jgi:hypothetical protein